jgi:glycosyltransferase involved in cell wall biosynthesis
MIDAASATIPHAAESKSGQADGRMRVLHLITGTGVGGAEAMLWKLLSAMDSRRFHNVVYSMIEPGPMSGRIRNLGVEVRTLGMERGRFDPRALLRFMAAVRSERPQVIQTWMYHADLLGGLAGLWMRDIPVVWNIRHADLTPGSNSWMTLWVARFCALLSRCAPARIVCCAESARVVHTRLGYQAEKIVVIPNGFDLETYQPRPTANLACRDRFGIPAGSEVILYVARFHPHKDHRTFFQAAKLCAARRPGVVFALCGEGITDGNHELARLIEEAGVKPQVVLLGRLGPDDVAALMSRSSLVTLSSSAEAFPNVVGEAMACGRTCVVTNVGDAAHLVGDTGIVVSPGSPEELAAGWLTVLSMDETVRTAREKAARTRIEELFSLESVSRKYQELYSDIIEKYRS